MVRQHDPAALRRATSSETGGTLGWRTEKAPGHDATVRDMLPHVGALMGTRSALSQIANYVHHQSANRYDVLRSNPRLLAADQRLSTKEFQDMHEVAQRYFRLIIIDSSNDESSYTYLNMLDASDVIVTQSPYSEQPQGPQPPYGQQPPPGYGQLPAGYPTHSSPRPGRKLERTPWPRNLTAKPCVHGGRRSGLSCRSR